MTEVQAKDLLDNLIGMVEDSQGSDYETALKMGIKALDMLDEIRAEIKELATFETVDVWLMLIG